MTNYLFWVIAESVTNVLSTIQTAELVANVCQHDRSYQTAAAYGKNSDPWRSQVWKGSQKKWLGGEDAIFTYIWVTMVIELKRNPESCDVELVLLWSVPTKIKKLTIHSMYS